MKSGTLLAYILCIVAVFSWAEYRSADLSELIEHLYYLIPLNFCFVFGFICAWMSRVEGKLQKLESMLSDDHDICMEKILRK